MTPRPEEGSDISNLTALKVSADVILFRDLVKAP